MKEMLSNWRNKKLWKSIPIDQKILVLNKEEMEIKHEMLKKIELRDQHFARSMEALQKKHVQLYEHVQLHKQFK